jgi:hypothetical protein
MLRRILLLVLPALALSAAEWHVAPRGDDRADGSRERPWRTLEGARDQVRAARAAGRVGAGEAVTLRVHAGEYRLERTLEFTAADSGSAGAPFVVAAEPGAAVRLTGGVTVPAAAFAPVTDAAVRARLPEEAREKVRVADLRALGVADFGRHRQFGHGWPVVTAPLELFWNDAPLPLARYPNRGAIDLGPIVEPGSMPRVGDYSNRPGRFRYTDPRHERWVGVPDVWLQGFFNHGFADDKIRVAAIDPATREVTLASPHLYALASGQNFNRYVALNLLEELDEPGEWYVDAAAGRLYLWAPGELADARVAVSVLESALVALDHASHVELRGLVIGEGRGVGVSIEGGSHCRLVDCVIRNLGTTGVLVGQGARQTFPHVTADDYSGEPVSREVGSYHSHIYVDTVWERNAGTDHAIVEPGRNAVTDCRIHAFSRRNRSGAAGVVVDGCGNRVAHNEIFNGDLQAIIVRGNEHVFEFNRIHHVALDSNDASAWYLGRDPSDQGNVVRWNFFHDVGRPDRKWMMGVYCDDATCGVRIEGNVFRDVASYGTVYSNGGHDIVVRNNVFIGGHGPAYQLKSMWYDFGIDSIPYYFGEKGLYTKRLHRAVDIRRPPYSERYPLLRDWLDLLPDGRTYVGMLPRRNVFDRNVIVKPEETVRLVGKHAQTEFGENFITSKDPGFVDAAAGDYRLRPDSPVFRDLPGFEPIPFERIGPRPPGARGE